MKLSPSELRKQSPKHYPATWDFRETWGVTNPHGHVIHFESRSEAKLTADVWACELEEAQS